MPSSLDTKIQVASIAKARASSARAASCAGAAFQSASAKKFVSQSVTQSTTTTRPHRSVRAIALSSSIVVHPGSRSALWRAMRRSP
jgi:hypothetical protein